VNIHPDILFLLHTALLSVSGVVNNHNLPQSGRLFILRVIAMLRQLTGTSIVLR